MASSNQETEIKLAATSIGDAEGLLRRNGFSVTIPRAFEANELFDFPGGILRGRREIIRLREYAGDFVLTYKGPPLAGPHKSREEIETKVADGAALRAVLQRLGLTGTFRYEKYRTEWARPGEPGHATLDETPIGVFLELEGPPDWIDQTAAGIGFQPKDYITASYATLYLDYCEKAGIQPTHMTFKA